MCNNSYRNDGSSVPWILNGILSSFNLLTNFDISHDESGMAMDILFRPRVEATEQMTQNRTFRNPRLNESAKSRLKDIYVVVISCFHSTLRQKT